MNSSIKERLSRLSLLSKDEQLQLRKDILQVEPRRIWPWYWWHPCEINVLLVVDGLDFSTDGFGLSIFTTIFQELQSASPVYLRYKVTLAHRFDFQVFEGGGLIDLIDSEVMQASNTFIHDRIVDFRFDNAAHFTQNKYDQVWLFGISSSYTLSNAEIAAVENYMNKGGGLFATGDHGALGQALCGEIPRVKDMRHWDETAPAPDSEVSMSQHRRNDTNKPKPAGPDIFANQSDDLPQTIYPRLFDGLPHPLLSISPFTVPSGIIDIMPDHPHEGEMKPETIFSVTNPSTGATQNVRTQNIAQSFVVGGIRSGTKDPTIPHCFSSIGVFDGRVANVGRIVVDSTWHHFVNINLQGFNLATMQVVKQYYKNISKWISRRKLMLCWYRRYVIHASLSDRIIEASTNKPNVRLENIPIADLFSMGQHAMDIVSEEMTPADAVQFELANLELLMPELAAELNPWHPDRDITLDAQHRKWINPKALTAIGIGAGIVKLRDELGIIREGITEEMEAKIEKIFDQGMRFGLKKATDTFNERVKVFTDLTTKVLEDDYLVEGTITDDKGNPLAGLSVRAVDQDFTGENRLGLETKTDKAGKYSIPYKQTDFVINGKETGGADIIVYVFNDQGELVHKTEPYPNSSKQTTINITVK